MVGKSILATLDERRADSACDELRAHGIKSDIFDPGLADMQVAFIDHGGSHVGIQVVVAPEDEDRAKEILDAWLNTL
jgi:hypothetical protein